MWKRFKYIIKKYAYKIVYKDLIKQEGLYIGKYDAKHGGESFMYGISYVMETLAYSISEDVGDEYFDLFLNNLVASEDEAAKG